MIVNKENFLKKIVEKYGSKMEVIYSRKINLKICSDHLVKELDKKIMKFT